MVCLAMRAVASSVADRISLAEDALAEAGAEVLRLDAGVVIRQPAFPHVYDANLVRRATLRESTLEDALDKLAAPLIEVGARHLQLVLDGADVPDTVAPLLRRRGFQRDRLLAMTLRGQSNARVRTPGIAVRAVPSEAPWDRFAYAMDRMNREESWYAPSVSREIVGSLRLKAERGALSLYVAERDNRVVGAIGLAMHRGLASLVSVGTLPDARGRGVARTMVTDMVERARARRSDLIYLIARADDSPKDMYRKLGFETELGFDVWLRLPR
jgi:ribosomal protein S18 acetylase RimI-like enzyme